MKYYFILTDSRERWIPTGVYAAYMSHLFDTDVKKTATMFRQMFLGLSYEQAFLNGLNVDELAENFRYIYSLLKA